MKRFKKWAKKGLALGAVVAMTATSIPMTGLNAEAAGKMGGKAEVEDGLVLHYNFESLKSGTIVNDLSGNGRAGVIRPTGSQVTTEDVNIYGADQTAYKMQGGQPSNTNTYVELPSGVFNGLEDMTVSCWVNMKYANASYQRIWDFGFKDEKDQFNTSTYMYLLADGNNEGHKGYTAALTNSGWGDEKGPEKGKPLATDQWIFTTVTFDGSEKEMSLYEDGVLIGTEKTQADLSVLKDANNALIGYGQFKNDILNGMVADFKIYDYAMTKEQVADKFEVPDDEKVKRDKEWLDLGDVSAVTSDLTLPVKGAAGSDISWASDNEAVITKDGKVTRPEAGKGDAEVTLTATLSSGNVTDTKVFKVTVKQNLTAKEIVKGDTEALALGGLSSVRDDLTLPTEGELGSTITWKSSDPEIIAEDGKVTRPVGEKKEVTLTATISYGDESATKEFTATVMPVYEKTDIVEVKAVEVETVKNTLPSLPATVDVTYENGTTGKEKVTWPTNLKADQFATAGDKVEVTGTIVDYDVEVKATVKVTDTKSEAPATVTTEFALSDISLDGTDTIYGQNMARDLEYLKVMDADRMLYNFRKTFGADTKGAKPLTGWEEPTGLLRGHSTGHFLSALAQAYASTGEAAYKEKMDYMVAELKKLQDMSKGDPAEFETQCTPSDAAQDKWSKDPSTWGEGFLSAYSPDQFALLEKYTPYATIWAPYYTLHKIEAGMIDCYQYGGNEEALEVAKGIGDWIYLRLKGCTTEEQREKMWGMYIAGEYGGMNESLARLYEITHEDRYQEAAELFDHKTWFADLAANKDVVQDKHANQHIPRIVGAVHEYAATGDVSYYNTAQNFWDIVTQRYAYSIGGVGTGEKFQKPYQQGNYILGNAGRGENCETCAAYNMLKLTKDLYNYNPDNAEYMDYYERTMLNQIAASQSHDTTDYMHNGTTYMLPIDPGQKRGYDTDYGEFTCCNGTGMENHVKYQAAAYAKSADTLYVNQYMDKWSDIAEENDEEEKPEPVLSYDFEESDGTVIKDISGNGNDGTMNGKAKLQKDAEQDSNVLYLDGSDDTFAALPEGFFDGRNTFSLSMDVKAEDVSGNYFTFAIGQDSNRYYFLKPTADSVKSVITSSSWGGEKGFTEKLNTQVKDQWLHLTLIMDGTDMKLYLDDQLIGHNENVVNEMSNLGKNLKAYLGKSFYGEDKCFKGAFDNIKVYNRVLTNAELAGGVLGDKTELRELLETYKDLDASKYTEESYQAFLEAYNAGQKVEKNPEALEEEVETAVKNLKEAIEGLVEAGDDNSGDVDKPGTGGDGQGTGDNGQSSDNTDGQNTGNGNKADVVKTGDTANIGVLFGAMAAAIVAAGAVLYRKKRR